jgi:thiazole synthase
MEMGADAVLVNTAIAIASDPNRMARAFRCASKPGVKRVRLGLVEKRWSASATSPVSEFFSD